MRKIIYTVNADGKVSPVTRQWGGTQGEHNATEIIFDFSALYENLATENWRIDFDSAEAGFDPGGTIRPLLLENVISRAIPQKYTKNGGEMTAILVGTEKAPDGSETVRIVCSIPVTIYFTEAERHEETEGQVVESLSEMERKVLQAAEEATEHIDAAEQRTLEKVADIQQKLDNGDFVGEKGDPFTYEDFTEEQLADLKGEPGDDYVLTEADEDRIAEIAAEKVDISGKADISAVANAVKTTARGTNITLNDISPFKHLIDVKVSTQTDDATYFETTDFDYIRSSVMSLSQGSYAFSLVVKDESKFAEWCWTYASWRADDSPINNGGTITGTLNISFSDNFRLFFSTYYGLQVEDIVSVTVTNADTGNVVWAYIPPDEDVLVYVTDANGNKTTYTVDSDRTVRGIASTYPTMTFTNSIGAKMVCEYNRDLNKAIPIVDQTYTPESTNAQSGIAVAEAVSGKANKWTTLIDTTLTEEQGGISEIKIEIPNWEVFKTISRMKLYVDIAAPEGITAQSTQIFIKDYGGTAYNAPLCWMQCGACNAGEHIYYIGVFEIFLLYLDGYNRERREYIGYLSAPSKYGGANSNGNATKIISDFVFHYWASLPPYLHIKLASGGIIGAGSKIVMEVC